MSDFVKADVSVDVSSITRKFDNLINEETMLAIHNLFAKMCDEYVPFLEGPLSQSAFAQVTPDYVQYGGKGYTTSNRPGGVPYARYQYYGVGFNHTKDYHPKATAYWDKAMMSEKGEVFCNQVKQILVRRAKQLYG